MRNPRCTRTASATTCGSCTSPSQPRVCMLWESCRGTRGIFMLFTWVFRGWRWSRTFTSDWTCWRISSTRSTLQATPSFTVLLIQNGERSSKLPSGVPVVAHEVNLLKRPLSNSIKIVDSRFWIQLVRFCFETFCTAVSWNMDDHLVLFDKSKVCVQKIQRRSVYSRWFRM